MSEESIFQKIAGLVGSYAPGLAAILAATGVGAPAAAAVSAIGALAKSLGMPEKSKAEDILSTIQSMPDSELKLKFIQAENDFQIKKRDQELEEIKEGLKDVQSARQRQTEHEKLTGKPDANLYVLAWTIVAGFFLLTGGLLYFSYTGKSITDQTGVLFMLLGTLATGFGMVLQYFFGSSIGSNKKTELMTNSNKKN